MIRRGLLAAMFAVGGCSAEPQDEAPQPTGTGPAVPAAVAPPSLAPSAPAGPRLVSGPYAPRDECSGQPGWTRFSGRLQAAVKARDAAALAALANPAVKLDFGGGAGRATLIERLTDAKRGPQLWAALDALAGLGCGFDRDSGIAVLPWFFQQDLSPQDPFEVMLAAGPAVPLRSGAAPDSEPLARLSWVLVKPAAPLVPGARQVRVTTLDSKLSGHVAAQDLRSQLDYRLIATRGPDGWRIDAFVAGD